MWHFFSYHTDSLAMLTQGQISILAVAVSWARIPASTARNTAEADVAKVTAWLSFTCLTQRQPFTADLYPFLQFTALVSTP